VPACPFRELGLRLNRGFQRQRSLLLTRIAATFNVSLCTRMKSWSAFVELESAIRVAGFICGVPEAIWFLFNSGEGIFLYDWWPLLRRGHLYEKLSRMRVEVRKRGE
jgi:hypothetical protein